MSQLETLLARIRAHLMRAEFAQAAALTPEVEAALAGAVASDLVMLSRIKAQADRNAALIDAARKGLRSARRRIDEVRRATSGVQTYDGQGRRADLPATGRLAGRF